jgi:hypothetical protein
MTTPQCGSKQHSVQHSPVVEFTVTHIILLIVSGSIHHCCSAFEQLNEQALRMHSLTQTNSVQHAMQQGHSLVTRKFRSIRQV